MFKNFSFLLIACLSLFLSTNAFSDPESKADEMIKKFDKNGNGTVERKETNLRFRLKRFRKVDLNKDRRIDRAEAVQMYQNIEKAEK